MGRPSEAVLRVWAFLTALASCSSPVLGLFSCIVLFLVFQFPQGVVEIPGLSRSSLLEANL